MSTINAPTSPRSVKEHRQDDKKQDMEMKEEIIRLFLEGNFRVSEHIDGTTSRRVPFNNLANAVAQNNAPNATADDHLDEGLDEEKPSHRMSDRTNMIMHFIREDGSEERETEAFNDLLPYIGEGHIMDHDSQDPELGLVDKLLQINPQLPPFCELNLFGYRLSTFVVSKLLCNPEQRSRRGSSIRAYLMRMQAYKLLQILPPANLYNTTPTSAPPLHDPEILRFILDLLSSASLQDSVNASIDQSHQHDEAMPQLPQPLNHMAKLIEESSHDKDYSYDIFLGFVGFWIALNTLPLANREICLQYPQLLGQLEEFLCTTIWRRPTITMQFLIQINVAYSTQQFQDPSWQPLIASRKLDLRCAIDQILCINRGEGHPLSLMYPDHNAQDIKFRYSVAFAGLYNKLANLEPAQKSLLNSTMGDSLSKIEDYILVDLCTKGKSCSRARARDTYRDKPMLTRDSKFGHCYNHAQHKYQNRKIMLIRILLGGFVAIVWIAMLTLIFRYISDHRISSSLGNAVMSGNSIYKASSK